MSHTFEQKNTASLLSRIRWRGVGLRASREVNNREVPAPLVSADRWWARRPHAVMGALLDAAVMRYGPDLTVSDPFSGGGTVTFEAARRGLKAYAQDLYPWPAKGLASALSACKLDELEMAVADVLKKLQRFRSAYYTSAGAELSHIIRVRVADCAGCQKTVYEFPHSMVSVASRSMSNSKAYFGCRLCGKLTLRNRNVASFRCAGCYIRHFTGTDPTGCPHCLHANLVPHTWTAVLVQELILAGTQLKARLRPVQDGDPVDYEVANFSSRVLRRAIPPGKETKRLLDNGYGVWGDLYTKRQANVLIAALSTIKRLKYSTALKDRLAFSVIGAVEMPAFLCRWDRFNLKAFEGMANHRYALTTLTVESNLLSPVGRGTLPRRLESAIGALKWLTEARDQLPKVVTGNLGKRKKAEWDVFVTTGSSVKQGLRNESVNVVITDPPYFDDVQYGELSRLFHTWLEVYDPTVIVNEHDEAVPNSVRGISATDYETTISACLRESRRTLKADGVLVLTFHNKKISAWRAIAGAIGAAGFRVNALAAVLAENRGDHCKRNVNAMLHDLVIECVVADSHSGDPPRVEFKPVSLAEKNLAAVGLALAQCVVKKNANDLVETYLQQLKIMGASRRLID